MDKSKIYVDAEGLYEVAFTIVDNKLKPYIVIPKDKLNDKAFCTCAQNLNQMLKVETVNGEEFDFAKNNGENIVISIGKMKVGSIEDYQKMGEYITPTHYYDSRFHLTTFELKMLSQGIVEDVEKLNIPFDRSDEDASVKTDLHTHFTGVLYGETLMNIGLQNDVKYPAYLLEKLGVDIKELQKQGLAEYELDGCKPCFSLRDLLGYDNSTGEISNSKLYNDILKSLSIPPNEQNTFKDMDNIYDCRWPFFSFKENTPETEQLFKDVLFNIGRQYAESGVQYTELAITSLNPSSPHIFEWLDKYLPQIEEETGVQIRFLAGMVRSADQSRMGNNAANVLNVAKSPWVVGCDFLGHEINSTMYFEQTLRDMARYAMLNDPSFVIRVHSGESAVYLDNTINVFEIIEDEMAKLQEEGHKVEFPTVRIGHSLNGVTDELIDKCIEHGAIIEKNYSSNLSLNNITSLDSAVIKKLIDAGVKVVLGTDGPGIYHTDAKQESTLVKGAGVTNEDILKIIATEDEYIASRQQYFDKSMDKYKKKIDKYEKLVGKDQAITMTLSTSENEGVVDLSVYRDLFKKQKKVEENMQSLREECAFKKIAFNSSKFEEASKDKKPIFIFGHETDEDIEKLTPEQRDKLIEDLKTIIQNNDFEHSYFVINAENKGLSKLFMKIYEKEKEQSETQMPDILGITIPEKAGSDCLLPVTALRVNERHKSEFDIDLEVSPRCQEKNGEMFFFGGGGYVSDIITTCHNNGLGMYLDRMSGGASADKAKQYQIENNTRIFKKMQENYDLTYLKNRENTNQEILDGIELNENVPDNLKIQDEKLFLNKKSIGNDMEL